MEISFCLGFVPVIESLSPVEQSWLAHVGPFLSSFIFRMSREISNRFALLLYEVGPDF